MKILVLSSKYGLPFNRKDKDTAVVVDGETHNVDFRFRHYGNVRDHRKNALTARARCKIDKCFAWQLYPGYDAYVHTDSTVTWNSPEAVVDFVGQMGESQWLGFKHPKRERVDLEAIYVDGCIAANNPYHKGRYQGEDIIAQANLYMRMEKQLKLKMPPMLENGIFAYKSDLPANLNGGKTAGMMTMWFGEMMRWSVQDQISLPYVMMMYGIEPAYAEGEVRDNQWTTYSTKDHFK